RGFSRAVGTRVVGPERARVRCMYLLGVLAERPLPFATCLQASTLETLSHGNRDGWAASMFTRDRAWHSQQYVGSSAAHELLTSTKVDAFAVIAQTHMRTLGEATRTRTPPFRRGRWVFAHGGAIDDLLFIKSRTSPERREQAGEAGGEMLFSFLLTRL